MTDTRDDWQGKYTKSGGELTPALPSVQETYDSMSKGLPPTPEQRATLTGNAVVPAAPSVPALQRDADGRIVRPDWSVPSVPVKKPGQWDYDNQGNEKPRDESGRYLSKSDAEMRAQWEREGGYAHVAQTVMRKEQTMYSVAPSLEAKVAEHLDKSFLMKAADHLRLSPAKRFEDCQSEEQRSAWADGFWRSVARFEDSLSPSELDAWGKFCRSLDADEQVALIYGMSK